MLRACVTSNLVDKTCVDGPERTFAVCVVEFGFDRPNDRWGEVNKRLLSLIMLLIYRLGDLKLGLQG